MTKKIPKWESTLWSYISSGDGMHCPQYHHCRDRKKGCFCTDDSKEIFNRLLYGEPPFSPDNYDFITFETGRHHGIFGLVEMLAQKLLTRGRVHSPPVPNKIYRLADEQRPIEIHPLPLKVYHGAIWHLRDGWVIQLKADDTPASQRLTLFHEVFHILAHCKTIPVFSKRQAVQGSFNELLADYFACCILLPREWVKKKWIEVNDLDRMAEIFEAPKSVMWLRLRQLGLI